MTRCSRLRREKVTTYVAASVDDIQEAASKVAENGMEIVRL